MQTELLRRINIMKLVILGTKKDGQYYIFNPENGSNILIKKDESIVTTLAPFPFENFSSLDKIPQDLKRCYLEVETDISSDEFNSMNSSGVCYYRFKNKNVRFIKEHKTPFEYSLSMLNKFRDRLGTHDLTTWVIHYGVHPQSKREIKSMKEIINVELSKQKYSDFSLTNELSIYLLHLFDKIKKGSHITFGRYGRNTINQGVFNKINLNNEQLITSVKIIDSRNKYLGSLAEVEFSPLLHPSFTKDILLNLNNETFNEILNYLGEHDLMIMNDKGFPMDTIFERYFPTIKGNLTRTLEYNDGFESLIQYFNSNDYEPEVTYSNPYDYYCCEDCDGYDILDMYPDGIPNDEEHVTDMRIESLLNEIDKWIPFITSKSKYLFDFIPESMYDKIDNPKFKKILM